MASSSVGVIARKASDVRTGDVPDLSIVTSDGNRRARDAHGSEFPDHARRVKRWSCRSKTAAMTDADLCPDWSRCSQARSEWLASAGLPSLSTTGQDCLSFFSRGSQSPGRGADGRCAAEFHVEYLGDVGKQVLSLVWLLFDGAH
jgi:hypothetical protein